MKLILKCLRTSWTINISVWIFIYLCRTFVIWEWRNPFEWIINIPTMSRDDRGAMLLCILGWQGVQFFVIFINKAGLTK